ncbi:MAG: epimerase, partial [Myxococcota bacterium]|nr:epimerase [Myxococcota bacterium]
MEALVIGGTGPTGPFVVNGLRERGYRVTILHTGNHETDEIPEDVEHIHIDPWKVESWTSVLDGRNFDVCMALYGRLRRIAEFMRGRCEIFVSVGGVPAYRGFMNPALLEPAGLFVPIPEETGRVRDESEDFKGYRIARTEDDLFRHQPRATHFRYPVVYGPRQPMPREWCVVRRVLDGRRRIILPDGGLTLCHCGYAENLAHALLLAVDQPDRCAGRIYNC